MPRQVQDGSTSSVVPQRSDFMITVGKAGLRLCEPSDDLEFQCMPIMTENKLPSSACFGPLNSSSTLDRAESQFHSFGLVTSSARHVLWIRITVKGFLPNHNDEQQAARIMQPLFLGLCHGTKPCY